MTAAEISERFHARRSGSGWTARCPGPLHAHGDRHASLNIAEGEKGTIVHCFTGCDTASILAAAGLSFSDLFSQPGTVQSKPQIVRDAEKQIADLRGRLTKREQVLPVTIVYVDRDHVDEGIARALALAVEGEIVQAVLEPTR